MHDISSSEKEKKKRFLKETQLRQPQQPKLSAKNSSKHVKEENKKSQMGRQGNQSRGHHHWHRYKIKRRLQTPQHLADNWITVSMDNVFLVQQQQ